MQYFVSFLEGIITFISPCLLPMLPIYISYFAGGRERGLTKTVANAVAFVIGFTLVFVSMGALAGTVGSFLTAHQRVVDLLCGIVVICFGLNYLGLLHLNIFKGSAFQADGRDMGLLSAFLFGLVFSVGWTPCVGAFLGSALMLASQQGSAMTGMFMLLCYSLGLGIPFLISAVLIDQLKSAFDLIKRHYQLINRICGLLLILIGILMATGYMGRLLALLS
ncbi:MAG: cytochrome c biogenesis protein CcdA [Oscillospiraceae bacterium]|nr:cytochrome c biogenesis protein CcdA [Oscillospiraceae bacterium]